MLPGLNASHQVSQSAGGNGLKWSLVDIPEQFGGIPVAPDYGDGTWVFVSVGSIHRYSSNWTHLDSQSTGSSGQSKIRFRGGVWFIVSTSTSSGLLRSIDGGENWADITVPTAMGAGLRDIDYDANNNVWVAVGSGTGNRRIMRSTDNGVSWTVINNAITNTLLLNTVISCDDGVWLAGAAGVSSGSSAVRVMRSTNSGGTWAASNSSITSCTSMTYHDGTSAALVVQPGNVSAVIKSLDNGVSWNNVATLPSGYTWSRIEVAEGVWIVSSFQGVFARSDDGMATWETVILPDVSPSVYVDLNVVGKQFVAVTNHPGRIAISK